MPDFRRPHPASPDEVRFTRNGDVLVVEYADDAIMTTHLRVGADKLAGMSDDDLLTYWNEFCEAEEAFRRSYKYVATEIPLGKPQLRLSPHTNTWVPRGHVLRCVWHEYFDDQPDDPCLTIDGRDYTLAEFGRILTTFAGWGMRIEFVPDDELHQRPRIKVKDPGDIDE